MGEMNSKFLDFHFTNPPPALFDPQAQQWVAIGIVVFLILLGVARIIQAWRK